MTNDRQEATFEGALAAGVDHRVDQCATVPGIRSQVVDDSSAQPLLADKTHSDGRIDGVVYLVLSKSEEKRIEDQSLGCDAAQSLDLYDVTRQQRSGAGSLHGDLAPVPIRSRYPDLDRTLNEPIEMLKRRSRTVRPPQPRARGHRVPTQAPSTKSGDCPRTEKHACRPVRSTALPATRSADDRIRRIVEPSLS